MERSRSRRNIVQVLAATDREQERAIQKLAGWDTSVDWQTPTLSGAWVAFGGSEQGPAYCRNSAGQVMLRGVIKSGTVPSTIFTLPVGFRPLGNRRSAVVSNNAFAVVLVTSTGVVSVEAGSNASVDLNGVKFRAEQ